jgi:hypothetical protein
LSPAHPSRTHRDGISTASHRRCGSRSSRSTVTHAACSARRALPIQGRNSTVSPLPGGADTTVTRADAPKPLGQPQTGNNSSRTGTSDAAADRFRAFGGPHSPNRMNFIRHDLSAGPFVWTKTASLASVPCAWIASAWLACAARAGPLSTAAAATTPRKPCRRSHQKPPYLPFRTGRPWMHRG